MRVPELAYLCPLACLSAALLACDAEPTDSTEDDAAGGKADGEEDASLLCDAEVWLEPVPVSGNALMAYAGQGYVFAADGLMWSVVRGEAATTEPIPLPADVAEMRNVDAEIAPNGRPLVTFTSDGDRYAAFFDGQGFVQVTGIGNATQAHADAQGHIYTIDHGGLGLVEHVPGAGPIYRGGLVEEPLLWGVGADGTVYAFLQRTRSGNLNRVLVTRSLPHGTLTWTDDAEVTANADWGFSNVHFAAGQDGSLHLAYGLRYGTYYYRSTDGVTWNERTPSDIVSQATLVDTASPVFEDDPRRVKGSIVHLAAQDYDHATLSLGYNQGSFSVPGVYHLRSCEPYSGLRSTWPAERFAMAWQAFAPMLIAVDERGLTTIVTPFGARQNVIDDGVVTCDEDCLPDPPGDPDTEQALPMCGDATVVGPLQAPVILESAAGYGHPLLATGDAVNVFVGNSTHWMTASHGGATTTHRPAPYADAETFTAAHSISGGHTVVFRDGNQTFVSANDGPPVLTPCTGSTCDARVAGDGHVWIDTGDLYEQVGNEFEARGGPPVALGAWDVDAHGDVMVASRSSGHAEDYITFWRLDAGSLGWTHVGALPGALIDELDTEIEGGFQDGAQLFAADGSFHLFSSARCIGTGQRNRVQYYLRSADLNNWEVEPLPAIETLAGDDGDHVGWRYAGLWAASYDRVRYIVMSSRKPVHNGWDWNYPGRRQLNLVERCRTQSGDVVFETAATVTHPGWSIPGFNAFSDTGVAAILTDDGLTQVF